MAKPSTGGTLEIAKFGGGLNLRDASGVIDPASALDALNVDYGSRGAIVQRYGYNHFTSSAAGARYDCLHPFYTTAGTKQLMAGRGTTVEALNTSGGSVATQAGLSTSPHYFVRYGAPASELIYFGNGTDQIIKWDGTTFTSPASANVPKGKFVAVQPSENRLVTAGFNTTTGGPAGAASNPMTVWFADPGDPTTWGADNYVHLDPGDGFPVTGLESWQTYLFAFKESQSYVFPGNSTDAAGAPVFNYRELPGPGPVAPQSIVAAPDGVYFVARTGVYKTTGGAPQLVSGAIDALFGNIPLPGTYVGSAISQSQIANATGTYYNNRLYFGVATGVNAYNDRMLVYDPHGGWWTIYSIPAAALSTFKISSAEELVFAYATGSNHVGRHSSGYTNDDGTAISARCRLGWFRPLDGETTLREAEVWAYGNVTTSFGTDFNNGVGTGVAHDFTTSSTWTWGSASWTWGSSSWAWSKGPSTRPKTLRGFGARGRYFSIEFANATLDRTMRIERIRAFFKGDRLR